MAPLPVEQCEFHSHGWSMASARGEEKLRNAPAAFERLTEARHLATAIADELRIGRKHGVDRMEVAAFHRLCEGVHQAMMNLARYGKTRALIAQLDFARLTN